LIFHPAWFLRTRHGACGQDCAGTFHGSWLQQLLSSLGKLMRAAPNTSAGSAKLPLPGIRLRQGWITMSLHVPRHALEIQPDRGVGGIVLVQDGLAGGVEDAQIHAPGVQIGAELESVRLLTG
jgi:hypothetical protein